MNSEKVQHASMMVSRAQKTLLNAFAGKTKKTELSKVIREYFLKVLESDSPETYMEFMRLDDIRREEVAQARANAGIKRRKGFKPPEKSRPSGDSPPSELPAQPSQRRREGAKYTTVFPPKSKGQNPTEDTP